MLFLLLFFAVNPNIRLISEGSNDWIDAKDLALKSQE